jgi:tetratricopeptide (TPR) repeat protein
MRFDFASFQLKWRAIAYLLFNLKQQACGCYEDMLSINPRNVYALNSLAHLKASLGQRRDAISLYKRATECTGANASVYFNLAFLQEEEKDLSAAEQNFLKAIELDPALDRAWYGLGLVLIQLGRLEEAVSALRHNTKLQPMSPYAWYQLARVYMDRHEPDEALKIIQHLKGFEPKFAAQLERETGLKVS